MPYFFGVLCLVLSANFVTAKTVHPVVNTSTDSIVPGRMLSFKDSLFADFRGPRQIYVTHRMKKGQTLGGLQKYYSISVGDLVYFNPEIKDIYSIPVGQAVRIPISLSLLMREDNETTKVRWKVVPVLYKVKPGETLYRVAKTYFDIPVETLKARNSLSSNEIKPGQILHIGWLNVKGVKPSERKYSGLKGELREVNSNLSKKYMEDGKNATKKKYEEKGTAAWKKTSSRDTKLYALHRTAPIGTVIKVYNPSNKRTLYVKVMGKMSDEVYRDNYIIYLSPAAAKSLGAVNEWIRVELIYYK